MSANAYAGGQQCNHGGIEQKALPWEDAETGQMEAAKLAPPRRTAGGSCGSIRAHVKADTRGLGLPTTGQRQTGMTVQQFYQEQWIAQRLELGMHWDAGTTNLDQRRERVRSAVRAIGLSAELARKRDGRVITAGMAFVQCYGEAP